jgi:hypothetical protein
MNFTPEIIFLSILLAVCFVFNFILLYMLRKITVHYDSLTKDIDKKTLTNVLQGLQQTIAQQDKMQANIQQEISKITSANLLHLQTLKLKRFNPFGDTGGDQSFILALLDGNKDGVVITSLHSRENTRFYVKSVKGGEGVGHPLSEEEQKTINRKVKSV